MCVFLSAYYSWYTFHMLYHIQYHWVDDQFKLTIKIESLNNVLNFIANECQNKDQCKNMGLTFSYDSIHGFHYDNSVFVVNIAINEEVLHMSPNRGGVGEVSSWMTMSAIWKFDQNENL